MPVNGQFYPRISYGSAPTIIDIPVATTEAGPGVALRVIPARISGRNRSLAGVLEALDIRSDPRLFLGFMNLPTATLAALSLWFDTWAGKGEQSAITLDRFGTCAGQWEYDAYNTYFSLAELEPAEEITPTRLGQGFAKAKYQVQFMFRQGRTV